MDTCRGCGNRTRASDLCRTCKSLRHHARQLIDRAGLRVETVTDATGSPWCAWDEKGNVLAGPADTKLAVILELGRTSLAVIASHAMGAL